MKFGKIKVKIFKEYKMSDAQKAHEDLESRKLTGPRNSYSMMDKKIISPCISICKTEPITGYCYGCSRTNDEKNIWKEESTTNQWKEKNLIELKKRMTGWQLSTFEESYNYKLKEGVSLFKKKLLEKK